MTGLELIPITGGFVPQIYRNDDRATVIRKIIQSIEHHNPGRYRIVVLDADSPDVSHPDVSLFEGESELPALNLVIETGESIVAKTVADRWIALSKTGELEIFTPKNYAARAKTLIRRYEVKARLIEY